MAASSIVLLLGWQLAAALLTATGYCSQRLAERGVAAPATQSLANYVLLALSQRLAAAVSSMQAAVRHHCKSCSDPWSDALSLRCCLCFRLSRATRASTSSCGSQSASACEVQLTSQRFGGHMRATARSPRWWEWALIALCDVEANYLLVLAYQYTDITSVTLLDAFTVPCVMLLSRVVLGTRYLRRQLAAVCICLAGLSLLVITDAFQRPMHERQPLPWLGDTLALVGAALYSFTNVFEEAFVSGSSRLVYFSNLGFYGAVISAAQSALLERHALASAWQEMRSSESRAREILFLEAGFVSSLLCFYLMVGTLLQAGSSAVLMNISLLTSDFFSVLVGVLLLHSQLSWYYGLAFGAVVCGLCMVEARSTNRRLELPRGKGVDERVTTDLEYELTCMIIVSLTSIYVDSDLPCDQMNGHLYRIEYVRSS